MPRPDVSSHAALCPARPPASAPELEGHYDEVFEEAAIGMALVALDDRILRANAAFAAMLGWAPGHLADRLLCSLCDTEHGDEGRRLRRGLIQGGPARYQREKRYRHRDGRDVWGLTTCTLVRDADGQPAYFIVQTQDITERKLAEQALRESEERFRHLTLLTSDGYWEQDEAFRFRSIHFGGSHAFMFTDALGLTRWEIPGVQPLSGSWDEHRRQLQAHEPFRDFRYVRQRPDGSCSYISVSGEPVFDGQGRFRGYRGTARDITESVQREERLHEARAMLHMAAQMGRLGGWVWDLGQPHLVWSEEVCAIHEVPTGFMPTPDEALTFVAPEFRDKVRQCLRECVYRGTSFDIEAQDVSARGRRMWVRIICEPQWDAAGKVVRLYGACQDISEAKLSADRLRALGEQLTTTLESLTDSFYTLDRELRFTYVNAEFEKLTGRRRGELLGRSLFDEFPQARSRRVEWEFMRALAEGVTVEFEEYYQPLDIWVQIKAHPSPQGLAVDAKNITERVRAREEILRLNAELEERVQRRTMQLQAANKELESFSYSIAHDLRGPLSTIDGFSRILEEACGQQLDGRALHYLQRIRRAVQQMGELTDGLLALSQLSRTSLRREPVDLAVLARAALETCQQQSPGRQVQVDMPRSLPAQGDPRLLAQVMNNLVGNAWKFTGRREQARIEVGSEEEGGEKVFFVRDNGAGFDMSHAGKLFEAFQRLHTPAQFDGTGIGLAIVQKIVTRHGGRVWAEAAPDQGACFRFTLPDRPTVRH